MFVQKFWHNIVNSPDSVLEYRKQQSGDMCSEYMYAVCVYGIGLFGKLR